MKLLTVNSEELPQGEADDKHGDKHNNDAHNTNENHRWFNTRWFNTGLKSWNQRRSTTWNLRVWIRDICVTNKRERS